jgi:hypothetical protein
MPSDHVGVLFSALVMMATGWGGLVIVVANTRPHIGAELWVFFLLLHIAVTGTVLPVVRYLNVRFTAVADDPPPAGSSCARACGWACMR